MQRREFITILGGTATFIPFSAWAQQSQPPLIGVQQPEAASAVMRFLASAETASVILKTGLMPLSER